MRVGNILFIFKTETEMLIGQSFKLSVVPVGGEVATSYFISVSANGESINLMQGNSREVSEAIKRVMWNIKNKIAEGADTIVVENTEESNMSITTM